MGIVKMDILCRSNSMKTKVIKNSNQERETEITLPFTKQWQSQKKTSYFSSSIMTLYFLLQELISYVQIIP
jgi:hypothetical protein